MSDCVAVDFGALAGLASMWPGAAILLHAWPHKTLCDQLRRCFGAIYTLVERPSIFIRDKPIFSSERLLHKDYDRKGSVVKEIFLVVILKGLGPKL